MVSILEAAMEHRHEEQLDAPADDDRDPWAIAGPMRCVVCRAPMDEGTVDLRCPACRPARKPRVCGITGCDRPARANGRCRRHVHGDFADW